MTARAVCYRCLVAQWYPTLCDPMGYSPSGSSVHGILQARILEWVAISCSRGASPLTDRTHVSCIGRQILYCCAPGKPTRGVTYTLIYCCFLLSVFGQVRIPQASLLPPAPLWREAGQRDSFLASVSVARTWQRSVSLSWLPRYPGFLR